MSCSGVDGRTSQRGVLLEEVAEFENGFGQLPIGHRSGFEDSVVLLVDRGLSLLSRGGSTPWTESSSRTNLLEAVPTALRLGRLDLSLLFVDESESETNLVVSLLVRRVVVFLEHTLVRPSRQVFYFLRGESVARQTGDGRMTEVVWVDGFIDTCTPGTASKDVPDSIAADRALLGIVRIVVSKYGPEGSVRLGIRMHVVDPRSEVSSTLEDSGSACQEPPCVPCRWYSA